MQLSSLQDIRSWLAEAHGSDELDFGPVREILGRGRQDLPATPHDIDDAFAAAIDPAEGWRLFVCVEGSEGLALIIGSDTLELTDWATVTSDTGNWITPESRLSGIDDTSDIRLAFDGSSWEGTTFDFAFGEGDWTVWIDGDDHRFDLEAQDLRYLTPIDGPPSGRHLDVAQGGSSMSTGDIGVSVTVDNQGGVWSTVWGCDSTYHGRVNEAEFSPFEYLPDSIYSVASVDSEHLPIEEMRTYIANLAESIDDFDPDNVFVVCPGFDGTARDLLGEPTPPSEASL